MCVNKWTSGSSLSKFVITMQERSSKRDKSLQLGPVNRDRFLNYVTIHQYKKFFLAKFSLQLSYRKILQGSELFHHICLKPMQPSTNCSYQLYHACHSNRMLTWEIIMWTCSQIYFSHLYGWAFCQILKWEAFLRVHLLSLFRAHSE